MLILPAGGLVPQQTFDCGQCFRWQALPDGSWQGVAARRAVRITACGSSLAIQGLAGPPPEQDEAFWWDYLALDIDYAALQQTLRRAHPKLAACVDAAPGIRVLRQPFWETLVTFLISQNNNIPRIKGIVQRLCEGFGEPLAAAGDSGQGFYAFPTAQRLAGLAEADLAGLRAGWRAAYILDAARRVAAGEVCEQTLRTLPLAEARQLLCTIHGVGPKVADCVLLYGLGRWQAYPVDVWIRRAGKALFTGRVKDAGAYLNRRTGGCAGIAQQYIFAWARQNL